jgi:hypothetical protein
MANTHLDHGVKHAVMGSGVNGGVHKLLGREG